MHLEHDGGEGLPEGDDGAWKQVAEGGDSEGDPETAELTTHGLTGERFPRGCIVHQCPGAFPKSLACGGEANAAGGALEEASADPFFEAFNLLGERGL